MTRRHWIALLACIAAHVVGVSLGVCVRESAVTMTTKIIVMAGFAVSMYYNFRILLAWLRLGEKR